MIPPSALSAASTENPGKTVGLATLTGEFERLLSGESLEGGLPGGKILPEGGKALPDGLPAVELAPLVDRKLIGALVAKAGAGASPAHEDAVVTEGAEPDAEADAPAVASAPETQQGQPVVVAAVSPVAVAAIPVSPADEGAGELAEERPAASQAMIRLPSRPAGDSTEMRNDRRTPPAATAEVASPAGEVPTEVRNDRRKPATTASEVPAPAPVAAATVKTLARVPIAPVLDPSVTNSGTRPSDAPQPARIAPGTAGEPVAEIKLHLGSATQQDAGAGPSPERRAAASLATQPVSTGAQAPQPAAAEAAPIPAEAPAARTLATAAPNQAQTPPAHDLTLLVDRLVEARDNARSASASLSVMHADFGRVSMHFAHDNGNLTVSLTNNDPGFARAVNAAVAADPGTNAEAQAQADRRADGGQGGSARTSAGEHGQHGERGGQPRGERHDRNGPAANPGHRTAAGARSGSRGIFA